MMFNMIAHCPLPQKEYYDYLQGRHWREFRMKAIRYYGHHCMRCGTNQAPHFNVHHITYENMGNEKLEDVMVLCEDCHIDEHKRMRKIEDDQKIKRLSLLINEVDNMIYYNTKQVANMLGFTTSRQVTSMCNNGVFPGAKKDRRNKWIIPEDEVRKILLDRSSDIEILPPAALSLVPKETVQTHMEAFISDIIKGMEDRHQEEVAELENRIAELEKIFFEEKTRNSEELSRNKQEIEELRNWQDKHNNKNIFARLFGRK